MAIAGIVSLAWGDQPTLPKGVGRIDTTGRRADTSAMGVRKRGLDIKAGAAKLKADRAARVEAELVIDRWNRRLATGRDMLWSPTMRAALIAGTPWLDVFCPGCGTSRAIDLRTVDRHPLARSALLCLGSGVPGVQDRRRCRSCWACTRCRPRTAPAKGLLEAAGPIGCPPCRSRVCWRDVAAGLLPITELLAGNLERWRSVDSSVESVVIPKDILIRRA
jgi:hypothetical protein